MISLTIAIIIITVVTSLAAWQNQELFNKFKLNSYLTYHQKEWWRPFTCTLIHADYMHLAFNMFSFFFIGKTVEDTFVVLFPLGKFYFLGLYVLAALFSSLGDIVKQKDNPSYNSIGASGAVSAVIFSFILMYPMERILVFVIPMPAYIYGFLFLGIEYYLSKKSEGRVNHGAHFEGAVFGIAYTLLCKPELFSRFINQIFG